MSLYRLWTGEIGVLVVLTLWASCLIPLIPVHLLGYPVMTPSFLLGWMLVVPELWLRFGFLDQFKWLFLMQLWFLVPPNSPKHAHKQRQEKNN